MPPSTTSRTHEPIVVPKWAPTGNLAVVHQRRRPEAGAWGPPPPPGPLPESRCGPMRPVAVTTGQAAPRPSLSPPLIQGELTAPSGTHESSRLHSAVRSCRLGRLGLGWRDCELLAGLGDPPRRWGGTDVSSAIGVPPGRPTRLAVRN